MDAVEYLKEKGRMCKGRGCTDCPLGKACDRKDEGMACEEFEENYTEEAVAIVEQWAKENPVKTYLSVLLERFPYAQMNTKNIPTICPQRIFGKSSEYANCDSVVLTCIKCWNREYKED